MGFLELTLPIFLKLDVDVALALFGESKSNTLTEILLMQQSFLLEFHLSSNMYFPNQSLLLTKHDT